MTNADLLINADLHEPELAAAHEAAMELPAPARIAKMLGMNPIDIQKWLNDDLDEGNLIDDEIRAKLEIDNDEHPLVELHSRGILNTNEVETYA